MNNLAVALMIRLLRNAVDIIDIYHAASVSVNSSSSLGSRAPNSARARRARKIPERRRRLLGQWAFRKPDSRRLPSPEIPAAREFRPLAASAFARRRASADKSGGEVKKAPTPAIRSGAP